MPDWAALLLILFAAFLPGVLLVMAAKGHLEDSFSWSPVEFIFAALVLGLGLIGWGALVLAETGLFSLTALFLFWFSLLLIATFLAYRARPLSWGWDTPAPLEILLLAGWVVAAGWLFFRPHEAVQGAADAGGYVNQAANIARTGGIIHDNPFIQDLDPALYPAFMRERPPQDGTLYYYLPGFNLADDAPGRIIPDFYPLHPVWQAVAYASGGVWAALRLVGLWAMLGALAFYLALRQARGWPAAMLGLAAISLCALQVWFARYTVAEMLTQFLLWSSLWATGAWLSGRRPAGLWAFLAALTLGQLFLVRIDTLFLLAVPVVIGLWILTDRGTEHRSTAPWYFIPLLFLIGHALLHAFLVSTPYAERLLNFALRTIEQLQLGLPLLLGLLFTLLLVIIFVRFHQRILPIWERHRRTILWGATLLILLLTAYGWFARPVWGQVRTYPDWYGGGTIFIYDHENLVRLGWYLSPVGVWLGAAGICLLLWKVDRRTITILGVGLFFSLLYLWRIQNNPVQIYAMRRYVPVVMPFFLFAGAFFLDWLWVQKRWWIKGAAGALAVAWLVGVGWSARGFISQVDYQGLNADLQAVDEYLAEEAILIFNDQNPVSMGDVIGTPLHYQYGHDVLSLRDPAGISPDQLTDLIRSWQDLGRPVYWVGPPAFLEEQNINYTYTQFVLPAVFLETPYDHKPTAIFEGSWTLDFFALNDE